MSEDSKKIKLSVTISQDVSKKLESENNKSMLLEKLLREYYGM